MTPNPPPDEEPRDETEEEPDQPPPRRMDPKDRRIIELSALTTFVALALGLPWIEDTGHVRDRFAPPEKVTVVPGGGTGTLAHAEWRLLGPASSTPSSVSPGAAQLRLELDARPLDATGVRTLGGFGVSYRLRDDSGHQWSATGLASGPAKEGVPLRIKVVAKVPADRAAGLTLEVLTSAAGQKGPRALLRFAR